ncbi:GTP cyclohydrolase II [Nocardia carnea]|uniref:GTP cyclohydrolase II n=1 Tax=Nocardia carnea TaxID=37328 RepID=A0ABW7TIH6_9NOCA|nr:GTP cyclohydrolase II [Nocardia carnea]
MTAAPDSSAADNGHRFVRNGHESHVHVIPVAGDPDLGHLLVFGRPADGCLVRVHSRCFYGESLGSQDCDCGPELHKSLDFIQQEGVGVLVYLEQEGRGAGLVAKAMGYRESERTGVDSFTAYHNLGFPVDARRYEYAADSLRGLGLRRIRLLTNNPDKVQALREAGLLVHPEPIYTTPLSERASAYLESKRRRRGHWIPRGEPEQALTSAPGGTRPTRPLHRPVPGTPDPDRTAPPISFPRYHG